MRGRYHVTLQWYRTHSVGQQIKVDLRPSRDVCIQHRTSGRPAEQRQRLGKQEKASNMEVQRIRGNCRRSHVNHRHPLPLLLGMCYVTLQPLGQKANIRETELANLNH